MTIIVGISSIYHVKHVYENGKTIYEDNLNAVDYLMTLDDLKYVDENGWKEYEAGAVFYRCCFIYYRDDVYKYGDPDNKLTEEETEKLKPVIGYMEGVLHERLGFTDEEMVELKNRLVGDNNNLLYDECVQIAKQRMERFK